MPLTTTYMLLINYQHLLECELSEWLYERLLNVILTGSRPSLGPRPNVAFSVIIYSNNRLTGSPKYLHLASIITIKIGFVLN